MSGSRPKERLTEEGLALRVNSLPTSGSLLKRPDAISTVTASHHRQVLASVAVLRIDHHHLGQGIAEVADLAGEPAAEEVQHLVAAHQPPDGDLIVFDLMCCRSGPEAPLILSLNLQYALLRLEGETIHWGHDKFSTAIAKTCGGTLGAGGFLLDRTTAEHAINDTLHRLLASTHGLSVVPNS